MEEEKIVTTEVAEEPKETPAPEPEETAETKTEEVVEEVVEKPKKTAKERIDELTRKRRDAERDAEYWRNKALEKERHAPEPEKSSRPRLDQFETTEAYEDALLEWKIMQVELKKEFDRKAEEQKKAFDTFNERARALREEYDDFDEVIEQPIFSPAMRDALMVSESGPSMAYYLGTRPAEAERIRSMPAAMQLVEIGRLEARLTIAKESKKPPKAPPPVNPVGLGGGGKEKDPSTMSDEEWFAWDRQRKEEVIRKKLGG